MRMSQSLYELTVLHTTHKRQVLGVQSFAKHVRALTSAMCVCGWVGVCMNTFRLLVLLTL